MLKIIQYNLSDNCYIIRNKIGRFLMRKNNNLIILVASCIVIIGFYIWRFSPFLPHINRNNDGSFTYENITHKEYNEEDFMEKFSQLERGKKIAIINKQGNLPKCTVYESKGANSENILIVHEEIIMSVDTYYQRLK